MHASQSELIVSYLDRLTAYARRHVSDPELAADAVQEAMTKAVRAADQLRDEEKLLPWLLTILRNTIADLTRQQSREIASAELPEVLTTNKPSEHETLCGCFRPLVATLPSDYGSVIEAIDLQEEPRESVASRMGITVTNLNVKLHRAREKLKEAIEGTCHMCAKHGCLNCTCSS